MISANELREYPLFAGLGEDELSSLAACLSKRTFAKDAYLFYPDSPPLNVYLVQSGMIRLFFTNAVGQEFLIDLYGPRSIVGLSVFREGHVRIGGAAALQLSTVLVLSCENLNFFMQRTPLLLHNVNALVDTMISRLMMYARGLATISLQGRIAAMLLSVTRDHGMAGQNEVELPLSQADIATWVGASRGALNRALGRLQELGLIRVDGQTFAILDRPGLQRMTEDLLLGQE
jgi:CRP/FNR family transcriptional regulator, cyclic AMP receptor protein